MPRLTSVTIKRFKQLQDITLSLDDITLLIGANNSGKSSLLQAIHFAVSVAQSAKLVGEGVAWATDRFQLSFNPAQLIYSPSGDVMALATGGTLQEGAASRVEIDLTASDDSRCVVALRRGRNRNIAVSLEGRILGEILMDLEHPFTIYAPGLAGVAREEKYLSAGVVRRIVARGDANLVLRNVFRMLHRDEATWQLFLADMQSIFPGIQFSVEFDEATDENIAIYLQLANGPRLPLEAAGTSVLQVSQLLGYIALFKPQLLILDEPDSHLHPDRQRSLCSLICSLAAERQFQVLISTHSRHVLDALKMRARIAWLNEGELVEQADVNTTAVLLDLGALDSADYFADGQLRCVVVSEDTETDALKALLLSSGFVEADTEIRSYAGCSKVDSALVLGAFLREKAPNVRLAVHRDGDYMPTERATEFNQALGNAGLLSLLTELSDVEGYFLHAAHLHELNPAVPVDMIQQFIDEATQETRDDSIRDIVNLRVQFAQEAQRRGAAGVPDHGAIALAAVAEYDQNPTQFRRGKRVLKRVLGKMRVQLHTKPRVYSPTPHLANALAQQVAAAIWPPA